MTAAHVQPDVAPEYPSGWTYNPSAWRERAPLIALAIVGFAAALYTGLSQLGVIPRMWDPLFGSASSHAVTHSFISRLLPVPDGLLGVAGYSCDVIFGSVGGENRWRVKPWAPLAFGLVITGLGAVSLALTILQATVIGHWCTICLISAAVSIAIFARGVREPVASLRYLGHLRREYGWRPAWRAVWGALPSAEVERPQRFTSADTQLT
ncbi:MAG TPA: vitamin K epoxide reductase family protein [Ktedonobacterales bacterium]